MNAAWLRSNAVSLLAVLIGLLGTGGGWLVSRARADDRVEAVARELASDKADLARHSAASDATHAATQERLQRVEVLVRDAAWNGYFVCIAQAARPDVQCLKPEVPR
jgi:hypothetical protein